MLKRLWSPTGLFKDINFHDGLNLILGRYSMPRQLTAGINGIGKSSVVRLLDFLLLSDTHRKRFTGGKYRWLGEEGHTVVLDLVNNGTPISIRRRFDAHARMVCLKVGEQPEAILDENEASSVLGSLFFPPATGRIGTDGRFRSLMPFFIKDDLAGHSRVDPVKFLTHPGANERSLTLLTMYLLGLPNEALVNLEGQRTLHDHEKKLRGALKKQLEIDTGKSVEALRTELASGDKRVTELTQALQNFNLLEDFKSISTTLGNLEVRAAEQRRYIEQSNRQLAKLHRFVQITPEIDRDDVVIQYRAISEVLGEAVKRTIDEVFAFRESLAHQRMRFHGKRLTELGVARDSALRELGAIEEQRSVLMRAVEATDFAESFEGALARLVSKHGLLQRQHSRISELSEFDKRLSDIELDMERYRHEALGALAEFESTIKRIRERFLDIVQQAIATSPGQSDDAYLDIVAQTGGAAKRLPIKISVSLPRVDALGQSRLRLVAYDLTVFLHQIDQGLALPRFLVHDGAFHAVARRTVVKTLNYVHRQSLFAQLRGLPFQYIATFNEDELTLADEERLRDGNYEFDLELATAMTVGDDPATMLFTRQF